MLLHEPSTFSFLFRIYCTNLNLSLANSLAFSSLLLFLLLLFIVVQVEEW